MISRVGPAAVLLLVACANMEPPPGAPPDDSPPDLISASPESLAVLPEFDGDAEFRFGEVISEGTTPSQGTGSGDLERLILLSPSNRVPNVSWKRNRITVKPAEGWQPNRVYRIELLPGVTDLRRNRSQASAVITFSTGAPLPTDTLRGQVVNWTTSAPAGNALVVATLLPDSLPYRAVTDSSGGYDIGPLPRGTYLLRAVIDQNNNRRDDPREDFDSVTVASDAAEIPALWTFPHDTVGPRVSGVTVTDSLSATAQFTQYLDPHQRLDSTAFDVLLLPDSTPVAVVTLLPPALHDSLYRRPPAQDTVPADTAEVVAAPPEPAEPDPAPEEDPADAARRALLAERPSLFNRLVVRSAEPWLPEGRYLLRIFGVRNVNGVAGDAGGGFVVPKPPPPDSLPRDSVPGDSVPPPPADSL